MPEVRAVLFDLDGTLVHSAPQITAALNQLLAEEGRGRLGLEQVVELIGDGAPMLVGRAFGWTGAELAGAALDRAVARYVRLLEDFLPGPADLFPGVADTLALLASRGFRLGVCTNKAYSATVATLRSLGLAERFGAVIGGDSLPQRKPQSEPLLAALDRLGIAPAAGVMVGDSANDVAAGHAAGLPVIAVSFGYPRGPVAGLGADLVIDRFADLPDAIARLAIAA